MGGIRYQVTKKTHNGYEWLFNLDTIESIETLEAFALQAGIKYEIEGRNFFLFSQHGRSDIQGQLDLLDALAAEDFNI